MLPGLGKATGDCIIILIINIYINIENFSIYFFLNTDILKKKKILFIK